MTVPGQSQVSYTWDDANRLTGITQGSMTVAFQYDNANRRTQLTLPNGVTVAYSYDNDSRVSAITYTAGSTQLGGLSYSYDADGRRTAVGGSLAQTNLPAGVSGNTFNADNAMTKFNGTSMSYDSVGELTSDGTNTYTWNARHQLTQIAQGRTVTASFAYDAFGRRESKNIGASTTEFLYDGLNPVQEQTSGGGVTANLLDGLNIDEYFTRTASGTTSTFLADALGSTIGLVTANGGPIATSYSYEPFGATTQGGASNTNPYQFTGRENDGTGLYYYRARYYSPTFQRFASQDPIGMAAGPNFYEYVYDDPRDFRDPSGNQFISAILVGATAGAIAGGIAGFFGGSPCASFGQRLGGALKGAAGGAILGGGIAAAGIGELAGAAVEGFAGGASGAAGGIGSGIGNVLTDGAEGFVPTVFKGALGGFSEAGFDAATGGGGGGSPCGCQ